MNAPAIRSALLGILSFLTLTGILPTEIKVMIEENADAVVGVILLVWSIVAAWRVRQQKLGKSA